MNDLHDYSDIPTDASADEIVTLQIKNDRLISELDRAEALIDNLEHDAQNLAKNAQDAYEALQEWRENRRVARELLKQICDHEDTMASTEIMLKLVMDFIYAPPDLGDIPF